MMNTRKSSGWIKTLLTPFALIAFLWKSLVRFIGNRFRWIDTDFKKNFVGGAIVTIVVGIPSALLATWLYASVFNGDTEVPRNHMIELVYRADKALEEAYKATRDGHDSIANAILDSALEEQPKNCTFYYAKGLRLFRQGKYEKADTPLWETVRCDSTNTLALLLLATTLLKNQEYDLAVTYSKKAVERDTTDATLQFALALAFYYNSQYSMAREQLTAAKRLSGPSEKVNWLQTAIRDAELQHTER